MQRREVELVRVIVTLMESPRPLFDTSLRQYLLRVCTLEDLNSLMTADFAPVVDHSSDIAALCVTLSQYHRENASLRRRMQAAVLESVDLKHRLSTTEK